MRLSMDVSVGSQTGVSLGQYQTPLGKLARRFKASLELWKSKYHEVKRTIKRYQNRARDARRSRDQWKEQARHWKQQAQEFEASTQHLQAELDRLRTKPCDFQKKSATTSPPQRC